MANLQYSPVEGGGTGGAPESGGSENRTDRNLNNLLLQAPLDLKSYQWHRVRIPSLNQRVKDFGGVSQRGNFVLQTALNCLWQLVEHVG